MEYFIVAIDCGALKHGLLLCFKGWKSWSFAQFPVCCNVPPSTRTIDAQMHRVPSAAGVPDVICIWLIIHTSTRFRKWRLGRVHTCALSAVSAAFCFPTTTSAKIPGNSFVGFERRVYLHPLCRQRD